MRGGAVLDMAPEMYMYSVQSAYQHTVTPWYPSIHAPSAHTDVTVGVAAASNNTGR